MKRYLIVALVLVIVIASPAVAEVHNYSVPVANANYGNNVDYISAYLVNFGNVTSVQTAQIWGVAAGPEYEESSYTHSGTFTIKNATGYTKLSGTYEQHWEDLQFPGMLKPPYYSTITNFDFDDYDPAVYVSTDGTYTIYFSDKYSWYWNSGGVTAESGKSYINFGPYISGNFQMVYNAPMISQGPPLVNYTCNFVEGFPQANPFGLVCTDDSVANPAISSVEWTLAYPDAALYTTTNTSLVRTLSQDGWYGLEYEACNSYGCGYANNTQLINITSDLIPETGISFWVHTYDPITGAKIGPSDIGIGNTTSGGWRNSSTNLGTAKFDSTDYARLEKLTVGQNVNLCGEAPGYQETCTNVSIAYDGWEYILNLVRTDLVPAGNQSTMIVNVINSNTAQTISGVSLTISNSSVPYSSSKLSDSNGIATFSNIPAAGSYQIAASKTGYVSATKFWPVYPGQVSNAYIGMLPVGVTPVTTGPGGDPIYITPTTTTTYAPGETPDTRTDAEKDEDMMNLLRDQGPMLIQFFIVCFVVYMVMGMAGKGGR